MFAGQNVQAAEAPAIGSWGANGRSYNYPTMAGAYRRALRECAANCHIVEWIRGYCAAYALESTDFCSGASGWATGSNLGLAQNLAMTMCEAHGGRNCIISYLGLRQHLLRRVQLKDARGFVGHKDTLKC